MVVYIAPVERVSEVQDCMICPWLALPITLEIAWRKRVQVEFPLELRPSQVSIDLV